MIGLSDRQLSIVMEAAKPLPPSGGIFFANSAFANNACLAQATVAAHTKRLACIHKQPRTPE
jgi:hypothetical protein